MKLKIPLIAFGLFLNMTIPVVAQQTPAASDTTAAEIRFFFLKGELENIRLMILSDLAHEKLNKEKHFSLDPSFAMPYGGGAGLGINKTFFSSLRSRFINQIDFGLNIDKSSSRGTDLNFLNLGVNFRKVIPFHYKRVNQQRNAYIAASKRLQELQPVIEKIVEIRPSGSNELLTTEREDDLQKSVSNFDIGALTVGADISRLQNAIAGPGGSGSSIKAPFFRAFIFTPLSPNLETNFKGLKIGSVVNFINRTQLDIRTGEKSFRHHLNWSLTLVPAALESGVILRNKDLRSLQGNSIFRFNTGVGTKLTYHPNCREDLFINRIELELNATNRHLFNRESSLNTVTGLDDSTVSGNKAIVQIDARYILGFELPFPTKLFGFKVPKMTRRPAIVVTYKNGFQPPAYGYTNGVTVHFSFVSDDKDNYGDLVHP